MHLHTISDSHFIQLNNSELSRIAAYLNHVVADDEVVNEFLSHTESLVAEDIGNTVGFDVEDCTLYPLE